MSNLFCLRCPLRNGLFTVYVKFLVHKDSQIFDAPPGLKCCVTHVSFCGSSFCVLYDLIKVKNLEETGNGTRKLYSKGLPTAEEIKRTNTKKEWQDKSKPNTLSPQTKQNKTKNQTKAK